MGVKLGRSNCGRSAGLGCSRLGCWAHLGLRGTRGDRAWRKLYNEQLIDLYSSQIIIRVFKLRGMRWAGHVARLGENRGAYKVLVGKLREKDILEGPGVDGNIISRWIFRKWDVGGMDWIELAQDRDRWGALVNAVTKFRVP